MRSCSGTSASSIRGTSQNDSAKSERPAGRNHEEDQELAAVLRTASVGRASDDDARSVDEIAGVRQHHPLDLLASLSQLAAQLATILLRRDHLQLDRQLFELLEAEGFVEKLAPPGMELDQVVFVLVR